MAQLAQHLSVNSNPSRTLHQHKLAYSLHCASYMVKGKRVRIKERRCSRLLRNSGRASLSKSAEAVAVVFCGSTPIHLHLSHQGRGRPKTRPALPRFLLHRRLHTIVQSAGRCTLRIRKEAEKWIQNRCFCMHSRTFGQSQCFCLRTLVRCRLRCRCCSNIFARPTHCSQHRASKDHTYSDTCHRSPRPPYPFRYTCTTCILKTWKSTSDSFATCSLFCRPSKTANPPRQTLHRWSWAYTSCRASVFSTRGSCLTRPHRRAKLACRGGSTQRHYS